MKLAPVVADLPTALCREIGRVIVSFANLEHRLSVLVYVLIRVPPEIGRLAVREPRATDRFDLAMDLMAMHKLSFEDEHRKTLRAAIDAVMTQRDQIAHGVWLRDGSKLFLRITRGAWQPVSGQRGKTKRAVMPESIEYGPHDARSLRLLIDELRDRIDEIGTALQAAIDQAVEEKSREPSQKRCRSRDRKRKAHPPRPRTSPQ